MMDEVLSSREDRYLHIQSLIQSSVFPIVVIKANIPGQQKSTTEANIIVHIFKNEVKRHINTIKGSFYESSDGPYFICEVDNKDVIFIKKQCIKIEDEHNLGRFVDLDVYHKKGTISRLDFGYNLRKCYICDDVAIHCMKTKKHQLSEIDAFISNKVKTYILENLSHMITLAMETELAIDYKFGLVTPTSQGSHPDMNFDLMHSTIQVVIPYLLDLFVLGYEQSSSNILDKARWIGQNAERAMFNHTNGINCYKGLIFVLGATLLALGIAIKRKGNITDTFKIMEETFKPILDDFHSFSNTKGMKAYHQFGIMGARGEVSNGLPSIKTLYSNTEGIRLEDHNYLRGLLRDLIVLSEDTTLLSRAKTFEKYQNVKENIRLLDITNIDDVIKFTDRCILDNLSFGGAADLLVTLIVLKKVETTFF